MFGKVVSQQFKLIQSYKITFYILAIFAILIAISGASGLETRDFSEISLYSSSFSRFTMWTSYFPISLAGFLAIASNRISDIYRAQTRTVLVYQTLVQILGSQLLVWGIWFLTTLLNGLLCGYGAIIISNLDRFSLAGIYIFLDSMLLSETVAIIWYKTDNKLIAFLGGFILNSILFLLNVQKLPSLIYFFVNQSSSLAMIGRMFILIGLNLIMVIMMNFEVSRKDIQ